MVGGELSLRIKLYRPQGLNPVVDQREELPLFPFGYPFGYVPAVAAGLPNNLSGDGYRGDFYRPC